MILFSQREGITPLQKELQRESIDDELRNRLWNILSIHYWSIIGKRVSFRTTRGSGYNSFFAA